MIDVENYPKLSNHNMSEIKEDTECGCYFCLRTCKGSDIYEFTDNHSTALCPNCGIDALLPNVTDEDLLAEGLERWFTGVEFVDIYYDD